MIVTFSKKIIEYWKEKNVAATPLFTIAGVQYWRIDVDVKDERMKDPVYVQLATEVKLLYPHILKSRLRLPLFTITKHGIWAATMIGKDTGQEREAFPLALNGKLLRSAYSGLGVNTDIRFKKMMFKKPILKMLGKAMEQGIHSVALYSIPNFVEDVPVPAVIMALKIKKALVPKGGQLGAKQAV